tara:strand:- start:2820 stop:3737 length:918 start_codon:yes stop_codon:yes gene_type:complete
MYLVLIFVSKLYNKYKKYYLEDENIKHYNIVNKYLLNNNSLAKNNKPYLWIHNIFEINSNNWSSFGSRNTKCMNQPYKYMTIKSIIDKCSNDFNVCVIDDNIFTKIIPKWNIDINLIAEPLKTNIRKLAISQILYIYGGLLVSDSFICYKSLFDLYEKGVENDKLLVNDPNVLSINNKTNIKFIGCKKNNKVMKDYILKLEKINSTDFTLENKFLQEENKIFNCNKNVNIIPNQYIGINDADNNKITLDKLMGNTYFELIDDVYGLYIPDEDILKRTKYQWFSRLSTEQILLSDTMLGKYFLLCN